MTYKEIYLKMYPDGHGLEYNCPEQSVLDNEFHCNGKGCGDCWEQEAFNVIDFIENFLPEEYELIIRTNRDLDNRSGCHDGRWFVNLMKYYEEGNIYKSVFQKYGDTLNDLLGEMLSAW